MKRAIRKFGLSLVPAMALAALFTACGDDSGSNGDEKDSVVTVPSDIKLADGNKVVCDENMEGVVAATADAGYRKCHDGQWEKISRTEALKADKIIGEVDEPDDTSDDENLEGDEEEGFTFPNCTSRKEGSTLKNPDDGKTYRCEDGQWVVVKKTGSSSSSAETDDDPGTDPDVTPGTVPGSNSSSSEGDEGASDELYYCDANGDLYVNPENCSSYVGSSDSEGDEGSSPSVDPDTDPDVTPDPVPGKTAWDYLNQEMLADGKYGEFLDTRDGQVYKTIEICDKNDENCQTWMAQNLNYDPGDVSSMGGYAWSGCHGDESANCSKYGRLYTWEVAMDKAGCGYGTYCDNSYEGTQGVCPAGWHLPTKEDWQKLVKPMADSVDDYRITYWYYYGAGIELKTVDDWREYTNSTKGTNASGFSALPAGGRNLDGSFFYAGYFAGFWSASERNDAKAYHLFLYFSRDDARLNFDDKDLAFSVRCVQNSPDQGSESSSPSVTPDPVPGSNSSSSSEVKPDGYYSNSSNCPADLDCKYATTTDYLNSSKTYGEILDTRDGQVYKTIEICDKDNKNCQTWMAQNLNYAPDPETVSSMGSYAWSGCYGDGGYDYSSRKNFTDEEVAANCSKYGRLYTWEVAMDKAECGYGKKCNASLNPATPVRGVCPSGWHLPSHYEFEQLINFIDPTFGYNHTDGASSSTAGRHLKSLSGWKSSGNGSDAYGFSALPGGFRDGDDRGRFLAAGDDAYFWSSGEYDRPNAFRLDLYYHRANAYFYGGNKSYAKSVRCLED